MNQLLTWVDIDLSAAKSNLERIQSTLSVGTELVLVVKSNAYGHGLLEIARFLCSQNIKYLAVSSPDEAIVVRKSGYTSGIIILYEYPITFYPKSVLADPNVVLSVGSYQLALDISRLSQKRTVKASVHLDVDLGIGKSGLMYDAAYDEILKISKLPGLRIAGLMAHLSDAENTDLSLTQDHIKQFDQLVSRLSTANINFKHYHLAASTAALDLPTSHLNMVRVGAAFYGLQSSNDKQYSTKVEPILCWKTKLVRIRHLAKGSNIGYGQNPLSQDSTIGIIPVGYALGLKKPHQKNVLVDGATCRLLGVNMSESYVNLDTCPNTKTGTEVTLVGSQLPVSAQEIAKELGTVSEDVITSISLQVTRHFHR